VGPRASDDLRQCHEREETCERKDSELSGHGFSHIEEREKGKKKERKPKSQLLYAWRHACEQSMCFRQAWTDHHMHTQRKLS
jgi:hypothetical protein